MNVLVLNLQSNQENLESVKMIISREYPEVSIIEISDKQTLDTVPNCYWNSILVVLFDETSRGSTVLTEIYNRYMETSEKRGHIIPISFDTKPNLPEPLNLIKSISLNELNAKEIFVMRMGAFLGLRWIPKESDIFISYRSIDGKKIAFQVKEILEREGFNVWIDEARDDDNEGNIVLGDDCQLKIRKAVDNASLVVLIDTPAANSSLWIKEEIDYANGSLVPILPLVFRNGIEKGPSFKSLLELQRWLDFSCTSTDDFTFSHSESEKICKYINKYLLDFHNRKKQLPGKISTRFKEGSFLPRSDSNLEQRLCYLFDKNAKWPRFIFTHAFCYPVFFSAAVKIFSSYLSGLSHSPHHYFIVYDGLEWSSEDIETIRSIMNKENLRVVHLAELVDAIKDT